MIFTANLTGLAGIDTRLSNLAQDVQTKIGQSANRAGAVVLAREVKKTAPVGPAPQGEKRTVKRKDGSRRSFTHRKLVNSIKVKLTRSGRADTVENTVYSTAIHASMTEFGSIHNAPNPFMERALSSGDQAIIDAMVKVLERRLAKAGV